jgi:ribonuclease HI
MSELSVLIEIDGGSRGNPGPAAAGVVIKDAADGQVLFAGGFYIGRATNNVAEYAGLIRGLAKAAQLQARNVAVRSDSQLMVFQMNGLYRVKNQGLRPLYEQARQLARQFAQFTIDHVPREENEMADRLVNQALDLKQDVEE